MDWEGKGESVLCNRVVSQIFRNLGNTLFYTFANGLGILPGEE